MVKATAESAELIGVDCQTILRDTIKQTLLENFDPERVDATLITAEVRVSNDMNMHYNELSNCMISGTSTHALVGYSCWRCTLATNHLRFAWQTSTLRILKCSCDGKSYAKWMALSLLWHYLCVAYGGIRLQRRGCTTTYIIQLCQGVQLDSRRYHKRDHQEGWYQRGWKHIRFGGKYKRFHDKDACGLNLLE